MNTAESVQQLLRYPVRKVLVRLVVAGINERHDGDRLTIVGGWLDQIFFGRFLGGWLAVRRLGNQTIGNDDTRNDHQEYDSKVIQFSRSVPGDRLVGQHLGFPLQALRRQFIDPGKDQRRHQADQKNQEDELANPFGKIKQRRKYVNDL